jgi:putative flippase GtrA
MTLPPAIRRFLRYGTVGVLTLLFDLAMLYTAVSYVGIPYYVATPLSFFIAVSCNYLLSRRFVFMGTERSFHGGYFYFTLFAILGAALTTALVALLVSTLGMYYLLARVIVAGIVGMGNYLFNLHINFNVAGKH